MEFKNYGTDPEMDMLVDSNNWEERREAAEQGYALDKLVNDDDGMVREAVARQGRPQDLDVLINDKDRYVREAVAEQGRPQDLDVLVNDESGGVRCAVAECGRPQDLDVLVNDESWRVRAEVAKHGRDKALMCSLMMGIMVCVRKLLGTVEIATLIFS